MSDIKAENSGEKWVLGVGSNAIKYLPLVFLVFAILAILLTLYSWYIRNIGLFILFFPQAFVFLLLALLQFERWHFYRIILRQEQLIKHLKNNMLSPNKNN